MVDLQYHPEGKVVSMRAVDQPSPAVRDAEQWAQLTDRNARSIIHAGCYCKPRLYIPHELLQRATGLEPDAYHEALSLLGDHEPLELYDGGSAIDTQLAAQVRHDLWQRRKFVPLAALVRATIHATTEALLCDPPALLDRVWGRVESIAKSAMLARMDETRDRWYNLGCCYRYAIDHDRATHAFRQVVVLDLDRNGTHHPSFASGLLDVGAEMQAVGDLADARVILGYAVPLLREHLGPDQLRVSEAQEKLKAVNRQISGGNWME